MTNKTLFLSTLAILFLIIGAGCTSLSTIMPVTQPVAEPTASTPGPSLTPTPSSDQPRALVAAETDATWKLYTNKALGYSVNTPTKGRYAPNWEMKYVDQSDPYMINGCYFTPINPTKKNEADGDKAVGDNVVVPDGTKFCHTRNENGEEGSIFLANQSGVNFVIDDYATVLGNKFIVIEFTKRIVDADIASCAGKMTEEYSISETACIPFVASDYQTTLDGIVGTFQMNTASN